MAEQTETDQTLQGILWMSGAIVSFSAMAIAGRSVSLNLDTFEIMMYRSLIGLVIVLLVARISKTTQQINFQNMRLHLARNICHFAGQNLWFYALTVISMAQVFALEFTGPVWVLLLAPVFLGEPLTRIKLICGLIGFIGVLIVTRPNSETINAGTICAALAAINFAATAIFTKLLTKSQCLTPILFWMVSMQAIMGFACAGYDGQITLPHPQNLPGLFIISIAGLTAHFCITKALSLAPASVVMPVDFLRLPVIAVLGYLLYHETINIWVIIGGLIIFGANYLNLMTLKRYKTYKCVS